MKMRNVPLLVTALCVCAPAFAAKSEKLEFYSASTDLALPFSDAVRYGDLLFLSGKIGNEPGAMKLAPGGIKGETRQALENIKDAVERYGSSMDRVIKCTVFLADMGEFAAMNAVYAKYVVDPPPTRSTVQVARLPRDARVEIDVIAVLDT